MKRLVRYFQDRDLLGVVLVLFLILLIFFSRLLWAGGYFAPSDIIRIFGPFADGFKAHNSLLSDPLVQFLPWFKLSRELLISGHFPLWNIYSGGGLPLLANMQSQVLWPFSVFIYFFNFKIGLPLYAIGKLLAIGFFTYLYLREIGVKKLIALIGSIGFMFAGFNVVWLMWPHTNEVFLLPLGFYLTERYFHTREIKNLLWFSLALAIGVFGGHPETFFHVIFAVSVYIVFNIIIHSRGLKEFFVHTARWLAAGILGIGLSAVVLVPFAEYLHLSQAFADRTAGTNPYFFIKLASVVNFIPDFFGNPSFRDTYFLSAANFNYNETTMGYVGVALLFLALYAVLWHWREKLIGFYILLCAFSIGVSYHFPVIFTLVTKLPVFHSAANHRLMLVFAFGVTVLGCLGLQKLVELKTNRKRIAVTTAIFAVVTSTIIIYAHTRAPSFIQPGKNLAHMNEWQLLLIGVFIIDFVAVWVVLFLAPKRSRLALLGLLVFIETGLHGAIYNTISSQKNFYPSSPTTDYLTREFPNGYYKTFTAQGILLPPNLGTWYGFDHVNDNDAVGLKTYAELKRKIGTLVGGWDTYGEPVNLDTLAFLGAKYLVFPKETGQKMFAAHKELDIGFQDGDTLILTQPALPRAYFVPSPSDQIQNRLVNLLSHPELSSIQSVTSYTLATDGREAIQLQTTENGYLVSSENFYPGWEATVNGTQVKIENVLGLRAIPIKAGGNIVETSYQPKSFRLGIYISLLSLIAWLGFFAWLRKKPRH